MGCCGLMFLDSGGEYILWGCNMDGFEVVLKVDIDGDVVFDV